LAVALLEALDSTTGVDKLLLTGEEGVALVAQFHDHSGLGGLGRKGVATGTGD